MSSTSGVSSGLLVGNAFPLALVRRRVEIEPDTAEALRSAMGGRKIFSFWGHARTLAAVNRWLGADLTPATERPALTCDPSTGLPSLAGNVFSECWVVSPEFETGFRPAIGAEVPPGKIKGWQVLRLNWKKQS